MSKKGVSLPITTIVLLSLAVLVLIVLVGMFMSSSTSFSNSQKISNAYSQACNQLTENGCSIDDLESIKLYGVTESDVGNPDGGSETATLLDYCAYKLQLTAKGDDNNYHKYYDTDCDEKKCKKNIKIRCAEKCGCSYTN